MGGGSDGTSHDAGPSTAGRAPGIPADPIAAYVVDGAGLWILATALDRRAGTTTITDEPTDSASASQRRRQLATAGWRSYEAYIRSEAWRRSPARLAELRASGGRCRLCARGAPEVTVEVHHNTYRRLRRERPSDLCTLCRECHRVVTAELRGRRYAVVALPALSDTPRTLVRGETAGVSG